MWFAQGVTARDCDRSLVLLAPSPVTLPLYWITSTFNSYSCWGPVTLYHSPHISGHKSIFPSEQHVFYVANSLQWFQWEAISILPLSNTQNSTCPLSCLTGIHFIHHHCDKIQWDFVPGLVNFHGHFAKLMRYKLIHFHNWKGIFRGQTSGYYEGWGWELHYF